ncbi:MAG: LruC domain-containing protein [Bacteroidetes bacterium]|nr:LruC domain-containing protein [Bacteroidota bacterium]
MSNKVYLALALSILSCLSACRKEDSSENLIIHSDTLDLNMFPASFNYRTTGDVDFQIQLNAPDGGPIVGVPVTINQLVNDTLQELYTLMSDQNGLAAGMFNVPGEIDELVISANYIGIPNDIVVPINGNIVTLNLTGARHSQTSNYESFTGRSFIYTNTSAQKTSTILKYKYLSTYNSQGVPNVMATKEVVTAQMLNFINTSVPERKPVPINHPAYLQPNLNTDLDITQQAEVWITFVHEGAGYKNSLCYYKYQTNNPPTSISQIDTAYVIFANASYYNSGGGLHSGDRVSLGIFPSGTSIGFICVSNGWNGSAVGDGSFRLFSDKNLNTQVNPTLKQQNVLLYDNINKLYYLTFEDISRDNSSCDNDFNDIVFYVKSNPIVAISNQNVPLADNGIDTDVDGVSDLYDEFPTDATLAYKNFLPAPETFGTIAFEDLWPGKGDYDFNDLVVGYQFEQWTNSQNKVKEMKCRFAIRAIGAHYKHGFGFQMNVPPSAVSNVTGYKMYDGYISLQGNKTEAGQTLATVIAFDNDYKVMNRAQGNAMNTDPLKPYQLPDTVTVNVSFASAKSQAELGTAPFNPFIIIDGNRGKEVHLAGFKPTQLANSSLFGTSQDNTSIGMNNFYKTKNNLPYALLIPDEFDYPQEKKAINNGHLKFANWAQSSGTILNDWYKNISGYRNTSNIYSH